MNGFFDMRSKNAAYFNKFKPGALRKQRINKKKKLWNFEKYADNTQGKCDETTQRVTEENHTQEYTVLQGLLELPKKGGLKNGRKNTHFTRSTSSQKMMVKRIGAAKDMCTLRGICAHLGEHQEDLGGRRSSFLFPRVSEPASSSQPDRDSCSGYTTSAGGHSTHRVVTIDENVSTVCDASAGRNSRKFQTKKPVHQQVKKRLMLHATKNSFDCVSLHVILKPWKSGSTGKQDRVKTALESLQFLAERLKIQPFTEDSCFGGSFQVQLLDP